MAFDDLPRNEIALGFAIVGASDDLPTDQLPDVFRFEGAPHTFSLGDESGRMLLQFRSHFTVAPAQIKSIVWSPSGVALTWCSLENRRYAVEFSTDLNDWLVIRPLVLGAVAGRSIFDDYSDRSGPGGLLPPRAFYRVRDLGPGP